jgi:hypothetical protein
VKSDDADRSGRVLCVSSFGASSTPQPTKLPTENAYLCGVLGAPARLLPPGQRADKYAKDDQTGIPKSMVLCVRNPHRENHTDDTEQGRKHHYGEIQTGIKHGRYVPAFYKGAAIDGF